MDAVDRDVVERIPVTSVTRTVIDLAGDLATEELEDLLDHVLAERLVPLSYLCGRMEAVGTRGREGTRLLAKLLAERTGQKHFAKSRPQRRLRRIIEDAGLPLPSFEHPVELPDGRRKYLDAFYAEQCLVIEVDSYRHHSTLGAFERDHTRNNGLVELGLTVLPVTPKQIKEDPAGVARLIARALAVRS
jgi:hypothetical protein